MKPKKHLYKLLFVFLIPIVSTTAQEYLPFPQDSAVWYSVKSWPEPFPPPPIWYYTYKFEANGDTLINNIEYTKFYLNGTFGNRTGFTGAYRILPDSNRVYYYDTWDTVEYLVYDFNMLPGDSVLIHGGNLFICVDTGSVILNNGISHKTQTMFVPFSNNCYQYWIHGLGSLGIPLLEPYWGCGYTFESAYDLTCFFYKDELIYEWLDNPYFEGCIGTNVGHEENYIDNSFSLSPNPVTGTSYLIYNSTNKILLDYQIINIYGNVIQYATKVEPDDLIISNSNIPKGIYVLRIYTPNLKQFMSIKFIIN